MYSKELAPMCAYCFHSGMGFENETSYLCPKKGVVSFDYSCRKYEYDPTKRIPPRPKAFEGIEDLQITEI